MRLSAAVMLQRIPHHSHYTAHSAASAPQQRVRRSELTMASVQAIAARPVLCRSPVCRPAPSARLSARRSVLVRASPEQLAKENSLSALEEAINDAKKQCDEAGANECASAWDTVEELSAAIAHKKAQASDPLDKYCDDNPEADECRVYED